MVEIDSRQLESAWPGLAVKFQEFHAHLPPSEGGEFEAIIRAAAEDVAGAELSALPPELEGNNQPQRDHLTRPIREAIGQLPNRLNLDQTGGTSCGLAGAGQGTGALVQKLAVVAPSEAEREGVRILLGTAAAGLARGSEKPSDVSAPGVFSIVMKSLRLLQPQYQRIPSNGIAWRGRPAFLTQVALQEVQAEAAGARVHATLQTTRSIARAGPVAKVLSTSAHLIDLVKTHVGNCEPTGRAAYVYYDSPGHRVIPHVDHSAYSLTALFMVSHDHRHAPESRHYHFSADGRVDYLDLQPGEMLLFSGGSVVHGRTPVARDEAVVVLTAGFRPL